MAKARALWTVEAGRAQLRTEEVPDTPPPDQVLVRTVFSGISRGTESLVFRGKVPEREWQRMRAPFQVGDFPFPVKYGYANVGQVIAGPDNLVGLRVFCLFPHQDIFVVNAGALHTVPEAVPSQRAVLAANMETALNGIWDAAPVLGDRVTVVGGGVLGCLLTAMLSTIAGVEVQLVDLLPERRHLAATMGASFALPEGALVDRDIVFHASASQAGLRQSLELCRTEGRVVELSWFGENEICLPLGADFHSRRLRLISSQVGRVSPNKPGWTHAQRLNLALRLLDDTRLDALLAPSIPFEHAPDALSDLLTRPQAGPPAASISYGE